jgi:hypothetical protein
MQRARSYIWTYIAIFLAGSVLGWCFEEIFTGDAQCDPFVCSLWKKLGNCPPLMVQYGIGLCIVWFIWHQSGLTRRTHKIAVCLLCTLSLECIVGRLSAWFHGFDTWGYPPSWICTCHGKVSLVSGSFQLVFLLVFDQLMHFVNTD